MPSSTTKAKYWLLTIPSHLFLPYLPHDSVYIKGQLECGNETGYLHWQIIVIMSRQCRLTAIKKCFGDECHAEPSRSPAAEAYVWKEDTAVTGTKFELGSKPFRRNSREDWDHILRNARCGDLDSIPSDVFIRHYSALKKIAVENSTPTGIIREVHVFWGETNCGKSHRAWSEAGLEAYPKDPCSKFWDGYRGQESVVIDEFRGAIGVSHMLRWLDKYPVLVEVKGSSTVFKAKKIWITSNLHPRDWYPDLDEETKSALLRRMTITHFTIPYQQ
jgi:hypothetical protein